jgi:hypothetical protein
MAITKELFKTYINTPNKNAYIDSIVSGSYDDLLDVIIEDVCEYIKEYCNNDFVNVESGITEYPLSLNRVVVEMIKYNLFRKTDITLQSKTIGDLSESYKTETVDNEYPESVLRSLNRYRKVKF